ncbi:adenylate/guanylate cyclase domain-containing protein [Nonomuraea gerenzanensis]|uniref:Adenylate cyclase n=1 Tax=Nonomuraea gerenzanensis TaxID=93944 RepID=A0A1M4E0L8_9ACTN|nr:adenylate/guanylate cyclase domain-containing protein [Nonomuraea gerenzanensis]UBU14630.1 adenylate/guanylate cyclase domain-containing protein [Nonomuraea gerenzanensis]SBO92348.1 Adenylate cyclase [Nonomuraea gerenzanensis]
MSQARPGRPSAEEIERLLVGRPPLYTRAQVAARSGVPPELAERIWRALGFAQRADDAVAFTEADVDALRRVRSMLDGGLLDEPTVIRMARALGQTTARLAQWQAEIMIGTMLPAEPSEADLAAVLGTAQGLIPDFEHVLIHVWRAQLAAAGTRLLAIADDNDELVPTRVTMAVGFADLVSFTRRSRELDEKEFAGLVEGFESRASDVVATHGARLVKTLGDEVLFTAQGPEQAAAVALDLVGTEELRIGMAYGPVLPMMGDVFGTTVNLAARLTAIARPGTILVDEALAGGLGGAAYEVHRIRRRPARGLGVVQPYVLRRSSS